MTNAFFHRHGDRIVGNDAARGPWSEDACHAGPVAGTIAGAAETLVDDKQLTRLTANFFRPIPMSGFRIASELLRSGRKAAVVRVLLSDQDERVCASAECLFLATEDTDVPTATIPCPSFAAASVGKFPVEQAPHGKSMFGNFVDIRYAQGDNSSPGPTTLWMHAPAIVASEKTSPFQSLCPLADCGNGISRNAEFAQASCVNPDLTIAVFRLPESDWLASQAISFWQPNGIGISHAMLFDDAGPIGTALQSLIVRRLD